jgi:hypothetical protein
MLICILYITFALTPSHFAIALNQLGYENTGLIFGRARDIRSDDFLVATALIRNVVINGFNSVDHISPYREEFRSFIASPILDWSLIFKPQFWPFFILPAANALSFYFCFFYVSFLAGYSALLRRLGTPLGLSFVLAAMLMFSQLSQVWWTTGAPLFALAPWPFLIFLSQWRWQVRLPILAYAVTAWLFADFYPPVLIALGFAMTALIVAFAPEDFALRHLADRILPGLAAVVVGVSPVAFYFSDLIPTMMATVYPGQRISGGGSVPWPMVFAHLFPHIATVDFRPVIANSNQCEVGVVGTFLPLSVAVFGDHRSILDWLRRRRGAALVWTTALALMLAWLVLPLPAAFGQVFLWDRVPPTRLLWGFGLLLTLGLGLVASDIDWRITRTRLEIFAIVVVAAWIVSKVFLVDPASEAGALSTRRALATGLLDLLILLPVGLTAVGLLAFPNRTVSVWMRAHLGTLLVCACMIEVVLTFGRFNPIQSAHAIFTRETSPFLDAVGAIGRANPSGWAAIPGVYGESINAFGVTALNHVLMQPDLAFFRKLYPAMPKSEFNAIFNRYMHVVPGFEPRAFSPQGDVVQVPIFDVGTPLAIEPARPEADFDPASGHIDSVEAKDAAAGTTRVVLQGWAPFRGVSPIQALIVSFPGGDLISVRAIRLPRIDVGLSLGDHAFDTAGFAIEAIVRPIHPIDARPNAAFIVNAIDENGKRHRVETAD